MDGNTVMSEGLKETFMPQSQGLPEPIAGLVNAGNELDKAIARVLTDVQSAGSPSRTGMAMLRDAADQLKRSVTQVGQIKRNK